MDEILYLDTNIVFILINDGWNIIFRYKYSFYSNKW